MMNQVVDMVQKYVLRLVLEVENVRYHKMVNKIILFFHLKKFKSILFFFQTIILDCDCTMIVLFNRVFFFLYSIPICIRFCHYCIHIFTFCVLFLSSACSLKTRLLLNKKKTFKKKKNSFQIND